MIFFFLDRKQVKEVDDVQKAERVVDAAVLVQGKVALKAEEDLVGEEEEAIVVVIIAVVMTECFPVHH